MIIYRSNPIIRSNREGERRMRKTGWKKVVAAGAIMMSLGTALPFTNLQAEEFPADWEMEEVVSDGDVSTYADEIIMYYRIYKGRRQKRRWNRTQGKWVDKAWIDLGPA